MKSILLFVLFGFSSFAQISEKWNDYYKRYDYTNPNGVLIGYKQFDNYERVWKYYTVSQPPICQPNTNLNVDLYKQVAERKQASYNANIKRVQELINQLYNSTYTLFPKKSRSDCDILNAVFYEVHIKPLNQNSYDLSYDNIANQLINSITASYYDMMANQD